MEKILNHIAFIVDGNRRWAIKRKFSTFQGHKKGFELMLKVIGWCLKRDVKIITFYIFSTENWKRSAEEVDYLINKLFGKELLKRHAKVLLKKNIKILFSGRQKPLSREFQQDMQDIMRRSRNNARGTVIFALNYGGRPEIVDAVKKIIQKKIPIQQINERTVERNLYTPRVPYPDFIVRTSGEYRLSNFLLWQSAYSELYFTKKYWPDFNEQDLEQALREYSKRERRFGA